MGEGQVLLERVGEGQGVLLKKVPNCSESLRLVQKGVSGTGKGFLRGLRPPGRTVPREPDSIPLEAMAGKLRSIGVLEALSSKQA